MDGFGMISDPNGVSEDGFGNATGTAAADFDHLMRNSLFATGMSPSAHEAQTMLDFNKSFGSRTPSFPMPKQLGFGIDLAEYESDDSGNSLEKPQHGCKKRLSVHQVHSLEKGFKVDSKLEPRRKSELARELGLKPRQVAIWFQNRRARQKNKQIEKDYDKMAGQYGMIKVHYDKVINENKQLKAQMKSMKKEMSLLKDSLLNYGKLMQAGLLDTQMMQTQPPVTEAQAEPQLIEQTQPELQPAYYNPEEVKSVCSGGTIEQQVQVQQQQQQQVISPANSVFDSNSSVVKPMSKLLAPMDISHHVVEPAEKRSANFMQCEKENSVNQEVPYELPNLLDLDEQNCFHSSQVEGPPTSLFEFGIIPPAADPFWKFYL